MCTHGAYVSLMQLSSCTVSACSCIPAVIYYIYIYIYIYHGRAFVGVHMPCIYEIFSYTSIYRMRGTTPIEIDPSHTHTHHRGFGLLEYFVFHQETQSRARAHCRTRAAKRLIVPPWLRTRARPHTRTHQSKNIVTTPHTKSCWRCVGNTCVCVWLGCYRSACLHPSNDDLFGLGMLRKVHILEMVKSNA